MNFVPISVSSELPIPLEDVKTRLQIEDDGLDPEGIAQQDAAVTAAFLGAIGYVEAQTGLTLRRTAFRGDARNWCIASEMGCRWTWCQPWNLARPPVVSVDRIDFLGRGEITWDELPASDYEAQITPTGAIIHLNEGVTLPDIENRWNAVQVFFTAGFDPVDSDTSGMGDDLSLALPADIQSALIMMTGHLFTNRDAVGTERAYEVPLGVENLLINARLYR